MKRRFQIEAPGIELVYYVPDPFHRQSQQLGYPFTQWSLRKLRAALIEKEIVADISVSNLQKLLTSEALSFQAVRTWKDSNDTDFGSKK